VGEPAANPPAGQPLASRRRRRQRGSGIDAHHTNGGSGSGITLVSRSMATLPERPSAVRVERPDAERRIDDLAPLCVGSEILQPMGGIRCTERPQDKSPPSNRCVRAVMPTFRAGFSAPVWAIRGGNTFLDVYCLDSPLGSLTAARHLSLSRPGSESNIFGGSICESPEFAQSCGSTRCRSQRPPQGLRKHVLCTRGT